LTKEQWQLNGESIVFSTNDTGTTGHRHAEVNRNKNLLSTQTLYLSKKLTQAIN
jgi:hypothetical protein